MAKALKPGGPLVFTYHHNTLDAYQAIGVAILDAALVCNAALPCPAEMGGSIHIHGTGSSIVDTVFVCRTPGTQVPRSRFNSTEEYAEALASFGDLNSVIQKLRPVTAKAQPVDSSVVPEKKQRSRYAVSV